MRAHRPPGQGSPHIASLGRPHWHTVLPVHPHWEPQWQGAKNKAIAELIPIHISILLEIHPRLHGSRVEWQPCTKALQGSLHSGAALVSTVDFVAEHFCFRLDER